MKPWRLEFACPKPHSWERGLPKCEPKALVLHPFTILDFSLGTAGSRLALNHKPTELDTGLQTDP